MEGGIRRPGELGNDYVTDWGALRRPPIAQGLGNRSTGGSVKET